MNQQRDHEPEPSELPAPLLPLRAARLFAVALTAVLGVSVFFRLIDLGRIPGINGDEAWFGVQVTDALAGGKFSWTTPTGNPLSPFHTGLLYLLHWVHPAPAFWLLRVPSTVAGLLLIGLSYPLLRRSIGAHAGVLATLLFACLPVDIIYARIGWDPSQSVCAVMITLGFTLGRRYLLAAVSFVAALIVHPSNVFAAPALLGPVVVDFVVWWRQRPGMQRRRRWYWLALVPLSIALLTVAVVARFGWGRATSMLTATAHHALDLGGAWEFVVGVGRLWSGVTSYRYVVGPVPAAFTQVCDALVWAITIIVGTLGARQVLRCRQWRVLGLALGFVVALVAFYLIAGASAVAPHLERYALFCVAPAVVLLAKLATAIAPSPKHWGYTLGGGLILCAALLTGFHLRYFRAFERTGGTSHETYRVGSAELKGVAFDLVAKTSGNATVSLLCESWWLYWPLRYLSAAEHRIRVLGVDAIQGAEHPRPGDRAEQLFAVGFVDGPFDRRLSTSPGVETWSIPASASGEGLRVWRFPVLGPEDLSPNHSAHQQRSFHAQ